MGKVSAEISELDASTRDPRGVLKDPESLGVPCRFEVPALARLSVVPVTRRSAVSGPGCGYARPDEPLVRVEHPGVQTLPAYHQTGWPGAMPELVLRAGVAAQLVAAAATLPPGFGLVLLDGWRSLILQTELYTAAYQVPGLAPGYVAVPSDDPATPPPHLTGGAVDVTLTWRGHPLALGTQFDEFVADARTNAFEGRPGKIQTLRRLLHQAMLGAGFVGLELEWWHFEIGTAHWAAVTGEVAWYGPVRDGGPVALHHAGKPTP